MDIKRGDIYMVDLGQGKGSVQGGIRPSLVIQNNLGNKFSTTLIVIPFTSGIRAVALPTHVLIKKEDVIDGNLSADVSTALCEQIRTIDKCMVIKKLGILREEKLKMAEKALKIATGHYNQEVS